jgi:hypothetical protein
MCPPAPPQSPPRQPRHALAATTHRRCQHVPSRRPACVAHGRCLASREPHGKRLDIGASETRGGPAGESDIRPMKPLSVAPLSTGERRSLLSRYMERVRKICEPIVIIYLCQKKSLRDKSRHVRRHSGVVPGWRSAAAGWRPGRMTRPSGSFQVVCGESRTGWPGSVAWAVRGRRTAGKGRGDK